MSTLSLLYEFFLMKGFCLIWAWMIASAASVGVPASLAAVLGSFDILNFFQNLSRKAPIHLHTTRASESISYGLQSDFKFYWYITVVFD